MTMPSSTGRTALIIGRRWRRGRSGGAGSSTSTPPYGRVTRGGRLNSTRLRDASASTARTWSRIDSVEVADLGRLPGPQHGRRGDRRAADDDAVLRAEVGDRDDVGDRDAGVAAGGLLVLDDDVVVGVATRAGCRRSAAGTRSRRPIGDGHDERRAERLGRRREDGVDRVDERQPVAGAHVDVGDAVVAARRLAGAGDRQRAAVVGRGTPRASATSPNVAPGSTSSTTSVERPAPWATSTSSSIDPTVPTAAGAVPGDDSPPAIPVSVRILVARVTTIRTKTQLAGAVAVRDRDARLGVADLGHGVLPVVLAGAAHHEQVAAAEVERQRPARRRAAAAAAGGARRR